MSIEALGAISAVAPSMALPEMAHAAAVSATPSTAFIDQVARGLTDVNTQIQRADQLMREAAAGEKVEPHALMIAMEEAQMSLMLAVEVRNKVVEAYQELMRMQM